MIAPLNSVFKMKLSVHQPCYLPYLGVFEKIAHTDEFVFLDNAQFSTGYVFNWNTVKTPQGTVRLKVPVDYRFGDTIDRVRIKKSDWKGKHLKIIEYNYKKSKCFSTVFPLIENVLKYPYETLAELNISLMMLFFKMLDIAPKIHIASDLDIFSTGEQRIIDICKLLQADEYFSGVGGKNYQDDKHFTKDGIKLSYTGFTAEPYEQLWGSFIPNLSVVDYLFNCYDEKERRNNTWNICAEL